MIPRIVHKVVFLDKPVYDEHIVNAHQTWKKMNPDYTLRLYNHSSAIKKLQQHNMTALIDAISKVRAKGGKANLFRFGILWAEGGWYTDWKSECLEPNILDRLGRASNNSLVTCQDDGNPYSKKNHLYQNAFVGSPPRDPCILKCIQAMLQHVHTRNYGANPLDTTGVGVWGRVVQHSCSVKIGCVYEKNFFNYDGKPIIRHKCIHCTKGQDWKHGNNYNTLWKTRTYYTTDRRASSKGVDTRHKKTKNMQQSF